MIRAICPATWPTALDAAEIRTVSPHIGEDIEVELEEQAFAPPAKAIEISKPVAVKQTMFLRLKKGWEEPIHPTPVAQKLIYLSGSVRVTASDGEFRDIEPGDVGHMEDKPGKGHHTVVTSDEDFLSVIVQ